MTRVTLWSSSAGDVPANLAFTNNFAAVVDPTVSNDSTQRYQPGSVWINTLSGRAFINVSNVAGAAVWNSTGSSGNLGTQGTPASQDTAATLTPAQLRALIITSNPAAAINLTLPLATDLDAALPQAIANSSFDFSLTNLAAAANAVTLVTNTGWTLVGGMVTPGITPSTGATPPSARFRARKTAAGAWTLYRIG